MIMQPNTENPTAKLPWHHPLSLFCTWFGSGLTPKAPGTFGTLAALPFAWIIQSQFGNGALFFGAIMAFAAGIFASDRYMHRNQLAHDPSEIVIDEVAGVWLFLCIFPLSPASYVVGFVFFRLFDICKPWPISLADRRIHGGFGVMFDDILATLLAVPAYLLCAYLLLVSCAQFGLPEMSLFYRFTEFFGAPAIALLNELLG